MQVSTTSLLTALSLAVVGSANAATISFNVAEPTNTATTLTAGVLPYGLEPSSNWTQANVDSNNLVDDSGTPTTLDVDLANFSLSNFSGVIAGNTVFDYGDSAFAAGDSWDLSQIPYAEYKIIVYVLGNNLTQGSISLGGGTTFYWNDPANKSTSSQSFTEITDTDPAGSPVFGNYVVFGSDANPLSGASQTISWSSVADGGTPAGGAAIVNGIQIVEVPEPSSLALMGLGGLLIARRRRN